ncbi:MAG: rhamnulokinase, partial [Dysgonamonadaceae bacterium]|jgi:rhamnulokinase|nr:rhamnulokinase [Dysgonamonadaceae bacterium]
MKPHNFLAFDLGATSGRSILATLQDGKLSLRELTRFPNKIIRVFDKYYWDLFALCEELKNGLKAVSTEGLEISSIGIDTWGVDFVYIDKNGDILSQPRSYRDPYTSGIANEYFKLLSRKEVYNITGIQIMDFNSIFQLYAAKKENFTALKNAEKILFMPDALSYVLTNQVVCEYTIASTSQLLNPKTRNFEKKLFDAMSLSDSLMFPLVNPGHTVGYLTDALARECGLGKIPVIAVAGHDTASAVAAVPAENERFAYLSSGTWSLMGIELHEPIITEESYRLNYTNEGGIDGTIRFLKNITGMWLLEQCRKEWETAGKKYSYEEITRMAESVEGGKFIIDPDHSAFANPESMTKAIADYCRDNAQSVPETDAQIIRCIFDSLAEKYKQTLKNLQSFAPYPIERLHVIGGGSQNDLLNRFTANAIGIPVIAGPSEATAIGNALIQAKGLGIVGSLQEMRDIIRNSVQLKTYYPEN